MQNYKPKSETKIKVTIKPTPTRFRHKKLQMWLLKMLLYQVMNQTIYTNLAFRSIRLLRDII